MTWAIVHLVGRPGMMRLRDSLYKKDWVVYSKPPFGGPKQVFDYLGNYTHRVAISNHRILSIRDGVVSIKVKDYADGSKTKEMKIDGVEFIRRFLLHVLPKGFTRIRHYGICASANVNKKLVTARNLLSPEPPLPTSSQEDPEEPLEWWERFLELTGIDMMECPICGGRLSRIESIASDSSGDRVGLNGRSPPRPEQVLS